MTNMELIGRACQEHRQKIGISQEKLAHLLDKSKETVSKFERGQNDSLTLLLVYMDMGFSLADERGVKIWHENPVIKAIQK